MESGCAGQRANSPEVTFIQGGNPDRSQPVGKYDQRCIGKAQGHVCVTLGNLNRCAHSLWPPIDQIGAGGKVFAQGAECLPASAGANEVIRLGDNERRGGKVLSFIRHPPANRCVMGVAGVHESQDYRGVDDDHYSPKPVAESCSSTVSERFAGPENAPRAFGLTLSASPAAVRKATRISSALLVPSAAARRVSAASISGSI